jgi:hypothetical protein
MMPISRINCQNLIKIRLYLSIADRVVAVADAHKLARKWVSRKYMI